MQLANLSGISLRQLLPEAKIVGEKDILVSSCSGHWSDCEKGDVFVAIDAESDGHSDVHLALDRGASCVLTERFLAVDCPQCIVEDSRAAYAVLCQAIAGNPTHSVTTVGVSGSQGKTVTCHLIQSILESAGTNPGIVSSLQESDESAANYGGEAIEHATSPRIASTLAALVQNGCDHLVLESPSELLAQQKLAGVNLDVAVLTNIRREHMELHGTTSGYEQIKKRLLELLSPTGVAILNADDPVTYRLLDRIDAPALTISMRHEAEVRGKLIDREVSEQSFLLTAGSDSVPVRTAMIGDSHIYNCLSAAAAGLAMGIDLTTIVHGLESVGHIPGRLERVECGQDFSVFVDSGKTPSQLASALHTLKQVVPGRIFCVCSPGDQPSAEQSFRFGKTAERMADRQFITSPTTKPESQEYFQRVVDGFKSPKNGHVISNRITAIEYALSQARAGDCVLISGCGERPIAVIGDQQWEITDRDVCQSWLYEQPIEDNSSNVAATYNIDDYRNN